MGFKVKVQRIAAAREVDATATAVNQAEIDRVTAYNTASPVPDPLLEVPEAQHPMKTVNNLYVIQTAIYDDDTKVVHSIRCAAGSSDVSDAAQEAAVQAHVTEWTDALDARVDADKPVTNDHDTEIAAR